MPYRQPGRPLFGQRCLCTRRHVPLVGGWGFHVSDLYVWGCCHCGHENNDPLQFCGKCGHARDLRTGELDQCLYDAGILSRGTNSTGPR